MAAGVTGTSQIDQAVERFLAKSRYTLQEREGVIRNTLEIERLPENSGPSVFIPKYGQITTYALTEGVDMTQAQQITDTLMTITPAEFGAQVVLTDLMMMEARDSFFNVATKVLRDSFDRQQDQTLCDDMDNYSLALGADGTVMTIAHVMAAVAAIADAGRAADGTAGRGGENAPRPYFGAFAPPQVHTLNKTLVGGIGTAAATQISPSTEKARALTGSFTIPGLDLTVVVDTNFNRATTNVIKGGVYSKQAQILVELGSAAGVEKERDASLRAWELNYVGRWARGEYNDLWGREMAFESAIPTS